jgi:hypothetical protein
MAHLARRAWQGWEYSARWQAGGASFRSFYDDTQLNFAKETQRGRSFERGSGLSLFGDEWHVAVGEQLVQFLDAPKAAQRHVAIDE